MSDNPDDDGDVVDLDQGGHWRFKNNLNIDGKFVRDLMEQAAKIRKELADNPLPPTPASTTDQQPNPAPSSSYAYLSKVSGWFGY